MKVRFLGQWWRRLADLFGLSAQYIKYIAAVEAEATTEIMKEISALRKRAEQGNPDAQFVLGVFYEDGQCGVPQDYALAAKWYSKAAAQEHARAEFNLGEMWANGRGLPQDFMQAEVWYRFSAEHYNANAQYKLGLLYAKGDGVPQDNLEACFWLDLASSGNPQDVKKQVIDEMRNNTALHLTPDNLSLVEARVQKWFEDHPGNP